MRLLLADDHALFRDALLQYIQRSEPEATVMLAKDLHEVMDIMEGKPDIDLVLLDLRMPGMNGLAGLEKMRETYPDTRVALLSGMAEEHQVQQALDLGVSGYFPKTMSGKAMLNGVHKILAGENYTAVDHNTNGLMPSYFDGDERDHAAGDNGQSAYRRRGRGRLTPREKEVLTYLVKGASNKEIASALDLQVVTVKLHVRGICRKLDAKNRTQAALKAHQLGVAAGI